MSNKNYDRTGSNEFCDNITGNGKLLDKKINKANNSLHHQLNQLRATSKQSEKNKQKDKFC